jgi:predicted signal transduction protein with EAL and GGDEF domain
VKVLQTNYHQLQRAFIKASNAGATPAQLDGLRRLVTAAGDAMWRLVDRADGAMYAAKQAGRDRVAAVLPRQRSGRFADSIPPTGRATGGAA